MEPANVAAFLLFDASFPRSIAVCVRTIDDLVRRLAALPDLRGAPVTIGALAALRAISARTDIDAVLSAGLHDFLDQVQRQLIRLSNHLASTFFGHEHAAASQDQA
jgi:uncharacterized alpha-E superfamily protein